MKRNSEIKNEVKRNRFYMYELAAAAGVSEPTLGRWLRTPLDDKHYNILVSALNKLKGAAANE